MAGNIASSERPSPRLMSKFERLEKLRSRKQAELSQNCKSFVKVRPRTLPERVSRWGARYDRPLRTADTKLAEAGASRKEPQRTTPTAGYGTGYGAGGVEVTPRGVSPHLRICLLHEATVKGFLGLSALHQVRDYSSESLSRCSLSPSQRAAARTAIWPSSIRRAAEIDWWACPGSSCLNLNSLRTVPTIPTASPGPFGRP